MSNIVDEHGHIIDLEIRKIYDRIHERNERLVGNRSAEAYLKMVLRLESEGKEDLVELCRRGAW